MLLAAWFGSLVNGPVADRFGRRGSIEIAVVVFTVGSALQAGAFNVPVAFAGRAIAGFSVGMLTMIVPMYMSEVSTAGIRGTLVVLQQLSITLGILVSYWLEYGTQYIGGTRCDPDIPYTGGTPTERVFDPNNDVSSGGCTGQSDASWRVPFALQIMPALVLGIGMIFFPESPRYYCMRDNEEAGIRALARVRRRTPEDEDLQKEYLAIRAEVMFEQTYNREKFPGKSGVSLYLAGYTTLFSTWPSFKRTAIGCTCHVLPAIYRMQRNHLLRAQHLQPARPLRQNQRSARHRRLRNRKHNQHPTCTLPHRQSRPSPTPHLRCSRYLHLAAHHRRRHRRLQLNAQRPPRSRMDGNRIRLHLRRQLLLLLGAHWLGPAL